MDNVYLCDSAALQNILTKACFTGSPMVDSGEINDPILVQNGHNSISNLNGQSTEVVTPFGSLVEGTIAIGEVDRQGLLGGDNSNQNQILPTQVPGPAIRCAMCLLKDGNLMMMSNGSDIDEAQMQAALASRLWANQVLAAKELEDEIKGNRIRVEEIGASRGTSTDAYVRDNNDKGDILGGLKSVISIHKNKMVCIVPCYVYLILLVADVGFPTGMLKKRSFELAKLLEESVEKFTPNAFIH